MLVSNPVNKARDVVMAFAFPQGPSLQANHIRCQLWPGSEKLVVESTLVPLSSQMATLPLVFCHRMSERPSPSPPITFPPVRLPHFGLTAVVPAEEITADHWSQRHQAHL